MQTVFDFRAALRGENRILSTMGSISIKNTHLFFSDLLTIIGIIYFKLVGIHAHKQHNILLGDY